MFERKTSDALGRRTEIARSGARMTESRSDAYSYNARSELTNAVKNATLNEYAYQYDDIRNRLASLVRAAASLPATTAQTGLLQRFRGVCPRQFGDNVSAAHLI